LSVTIAQKIGMTQVFNEAGLAQVATVLAVPDVFVSQVKTTQKDGYQATQIGYANSKKAKASVTGKLKKAGVAANLTNFVEVSEPDLKVGEKLSLDSFKADDYVTVVGISKGKGFAGTVKRHNFATGPKTHGSHNYRQPGSIGSAYPERVVLGKKMAGHMGVERITVKGLKVLSVSDTDKTIVINGPIPGPNKSYVLIKGSNE
jgi:large subunit ribosomal protein L3